MIIDTDMQASIFFTNQYYCTGPGAAGRLNDSLFLHLRQLPPVLVQMGFSRLAASLALHLQCQW